MKWSLLGDLWSGDPGGRTVSKEDSEVAEKVGRGKASDGDGADTAGLSYTQVVSSSSSEGRSSTLKRGTSHNMDRNVKLGAKRPRSLLDGACGICFRTSHSTAECRHRVVCLRCSGWVMLLHGAQWKIGEPQEGEEFM